ncbi:LOW QUALITY PROTEIN: hypothetical protein NC652_017849 [Populus alba x Populus x berolinensis]|nr:LOW QUALITY PROTEIN: hypothetical protein NC652_017849 [Populus alba x Populus x berolinensis]
MSFCSSISTPQSLSLLSKTKPIINGGDYKLGSRFRASADVPDFLSADWFSAEEAVNCQLDALKYNDQPRQDYGIEVILLDLILSKGLLILGHFFDLGQEDFSPFDLSSVAWSQGEEDLEQFVRERGRVRHVSILSFCLLLDKQMSLSEFTNGCICAGRRGFLSNYES